jgi:hypothetical protein
MKERGLLNARKSSNNAIKTFDTFRWNDRFVAAMIGADQAHDVSAPCPKQPF